MNKTYIKEEQLYDFLDTKVKESWIESCQSNSSLNGWVKRMYYQDREFFITNNMSINTWVEGENLVYLGKIDSYIEINTTEDEELTYDDYELEWLNWGRDQIIDNIFDNSQNCNEENFEII